MRFFSGSRLPLATESNRELQRSFFSAFRPSDAPEADVYVETLFALAVMFTAVPFPSWEECWVASVGVWGDAFGA
jgi:hypothetical protein